MSVQSGVEHHGAGDDQGAAHGGGIVAGGLPAADGAVVFAGVAVLVAARFRRGGQIQALRQAFLLVEGQQLNGLADFVGQAGGGQVGVAQLGRRQGYRRRQVGWRAFGPLGGAVVLVQDGVGQAGVGQGVLVGVIGVADGDGGVAVAVVNAVEAVGHGVFPLAVALPRFGFNDDNMAAEADAAVGAPAALALEGALGAGAQALLAEDDAEGGVEVLLVGARHNGAPVRARLVAAWAALAYYNTESGGGGNGGGGGIPGDGGDPVARGGCIYAARKAIMWAALSFPSAPCP